MIKYPEIKPFAECFKIAGPITGIDKIENGHINATYVIACEGNDGKQIRYILQTINTKIFTDPVSLMENIKNVTDYLKNIIRENGGDVNRETLTCIETVDGLIYHVDDQNRYWRMYNYIEDATKLASGYAIHSASK